MAHGKGKRYSVFVDVCLLGAQSNVGRRDDKVGPCLRPGHLHVCTAYYLSWTVSQSDWLSPSLQRISLQTAFLKFQRIVVLLDYSEKCCYYLHNSHSIFFPCSLRDMRSLAAVVDRLAAEVPDSLWVKAPAFSSHGEELCWQDITWLQLSRAVDAMAHWMEAHLGQPTTENEPVAYMGVNDIRYPIAILAALKTGYKVSQT
jgi:hypothetical protein